jgi:hypothetical protein
MAGMSNRREAGNPETQSSGEASTAGGDQIAAYLKELHRRLTSGMVRTSSEHAAQIVAEAENHLREAAAMCVAAGMRQHVAQLAAIEAFGGARTVARAHRPRAAAVLTKLAAAACPLLAAYLLVAAAIGLAVVYREAGILGGGMQGVPLGQAAVAAPGPASGFPAGQGALLIVACAFAGLVVFAGYLIACQRRRSRRGVARTVPLPGGYELGVGAIVAAVVIALACGAWSAVLLARWTVNRLTHRPSAVVRA